LKNNIVTFALIVAAIVLFALHPHSIAWSPVRVVGATIAAVSFALLIVARWQLGPSFSVQAKAHRLVTTGLYSRFRNPIYLFSGTFLAGISLFRCLWGPVGVAAILVPLQWLRAHKEEQVLAAAFGDEYTEYRRQNLVLGRIDI
jgi:protein-S-isoprenylcysteine O-methyltransferase Ste14